MKKFFEDESQDFGFYSHTHTLLLSDSIPSVIQICHEKITDSIERFTRRGSGYIFDKIKDVFLHVTLFRPLEGFAGGSFIPLPPKLKSKRCLKTYTI